MAGDTDIEWADKSWNPIVGCSLVSAGCTNCYAMRQARRFRDHPTSVYRDLTRDRRGKGAVWTGEVRMAPEKTLLAPLRWRKPARIFVNSMGDLFHEDVPDAWIDSVFAVMASAPQHLFMVLTKRPARMLDYMNWPGRAGMVGARVIQASPDANPVRQPPDYTYRSSWWPLPNLWLGVSIEDQETADARIPDLLATPAAGRTLDGRTHDALPPLPEVRPHDQS